MADFRFFTTKVECGADELSAAECHHAISVMRLKSGDEVVLFDGRGRLGFGKLAGDTAVRAGRKAKAARGAEVIVERIEDIPRPVRELTLIVSGCKGERLDWLVEKCTELGVTRIVLAEFERSVVHVGEKHAEKLRRGAIEACKQCKRAWLPEIDAGAALMTAVQAAQGRGAALLVAEPDPAAPMLAAWLASRGKAAREAAIVVGPEGGLTTDETRRLHEVGAVSVRLAEHILRVETAAIAAAAIWQANEAMFDS